MRYKNGNGLVDVSSLFSLVPLKDDNIWLQPAVTESGYDIEWITEVCIKHPSVLCFWILFVTYFSWLSKRDLNWSSIECVKCRGLVSEHLCSSPTGSESEQNTWSAGFMRSGEFTWRFQDLMIAVLESSLWKTHVSPWFFFRQLYIWKRISGVKYNVIEELIDWPFPCTGLKSLLKPSEYLTHSLHGLVQCWCNVACGTLLCHWWLPLTSPFTNVLIYQFHIVQCDLN